MNNIHLYVDGCFKPLFVPYEPLFLTLSDEMKNKLRTIWSDFTTPDEKILIKIKKPSESYIKL